MSDQGSKFEFRQLSEADLPAMLALREEVLGFPRTEPNELDGKLGTILVGEFDGDRLIGTAQFAPAEDPILFKARRVAVHPDYQGRGVGTDMMVRGEDIVRKKEAQAVVLDARDEKAVQFYLRLGYILTGKTIDEHDGWIAQEMIKAL